MDDGVDGADAAARNGRLRRRTLLTTAAALSVVPAAMPGGNGAGGIASAGTTVSGLTVEHRTDPLGIDAAHPRFGWRMASTARGRHQTAYRIKVATSPRHLTHGSADVWDSGRVDAADSVAVRYSGPALRASTRYHWTVTVWDEHGRAVTAAPGAHFETGLLSTDGVTGWDGAQWIGMAGKRPNTAGAPLLRSQTALTGGQVTEARLYLSALGVYDAYVNGRRVSVPQGDGTTYEFLPPGWTNYDTTVNYFTYDVTDLLADPAQVTLAAVLGNGWYNGRVSENSTHYSADGNPWPSRRNSSSGTPTAPPGRSSPPPAPTGEPPTPAPTAPTTSTTASSTTPARNSRVGRRTASTPRPGRPSRLKTLSPTPSWSRIPARAPA